MILAQYYPISKKAVCINYINEDFARNQKDNFTVGAWKIKSK